MTSRWVLLSLFVFLLLAPHGAMAAQAVVTCDAPASGADVSKVTGADTMVFVPEISVPGFTAGSQTIITGTSIGSYIKGVFVIMVWSIGVLAVVMVIYGGIKWVAAAGDSGRINDAKDVITNAIIGLVIGLTSVLLLQLINPNFVNLKGLNVASVDRCSIATLEDAVKVAGDLGSGGVDEPLCAAPMINGVPDSVKFATPGQPTLSKFDDMIREASSFRRSDGTQVSVDPMLIKAIIMGEAARDGNAVVSGPTNGKACADQSNARCRLKGTAYGIVQMTHATLVTNWQKVEGSVPSACDSDKESDWRKADGSLGTQCAAILDNGRDGAVLQLKIMANEIYDAVKSSAIKNSVTYIAGAYHLGVGGIQQYMRNHQSTDESGTATAAYLSAFNKRYHQMCQDAVNARYDQGPTGAFRDQ